MKKSEKIFTLCGHTKAYAVYICQDMSQQIQASRSKFGHYVMAQLRHTLRAIYAYKTV